MGTSSLYSSNSLSSLTKASSSLETLGVWSIIALVIAVAGGIALYFTFLSKKNDGKWTGFLGWLYNTLTFKNMIVETILKILYLVIAIFITLYSLGLIAVNIISALLLLIVGNILLRVCYEFMLLAIITCRNTSDINSKLSKIVSDKKEDKQPEQEQQVNSQE